MCTITIETRDVGTQYEPFIPEASTPQKSTSVATPVLCVDPDWTPIKCPPSPESACSPPSSAPPSPSLDSSYEPTDLSLQEARDDTIIDVEDPMEYVL